MDIFNQLTFNDIDTESYLPLFFRLDNPDLLKELTGLIERKKDIVIIDDISSQLKELIKSLHPSRRIKQEEYPELIMKHLNGTDEKSYGVWVYYPWLNKMIHLLDEEEFVEVRTNRNRYKITRDEQKVLQRKKVGIIGLSVGQSIALTLAMERTCGELRLADFDTAELSNLNRIRTGVQNLGIKKTIIAAREIAEIDPFIRVKIYSDGISSDNINSFFTEGGNIDLMVEVCDGLDIKIISRYKARELRIPVVMDTNDRGMLDIERFDLEPQREVLHGLAGGVNVDTLATISNGEKISLVLNIAGREQISVRGRASMIEVEQSINTWPQLASSVVLGGAVTTDVCRRIFLNHLTVSGRFYVDLDDIISEGKDTPRTDYFNPFKPLDKAEVERIIAKVSPKPTDSYSLSSEQLKGLVKAATAAPSTGNDQPWKWYYDAGSIYLLHDQHRSFSFGDYNKIASYLSFGAAQENLILAAQDLGLHISSEIFPLGEDSELIAKFTFSENVVVGEEERLNSDLVKYIFSRNTNRNNVPQKDKIPDDVLTGLKDTAESVKGAELKWLTGREEIFEIGKIIGACDRIRLLNEKGHDDFVNREMRWTETEAEETRDGIDVMTLGLSKPQISALEILRDPQVIDFLNDVKGGTLLEEATLRSMINSGAVGLITLPVASPENYILGGRSLERLWLVAEQHNLALHPVISPIYLFHRAIKGNGEDLSKSNIEELHALRKKFINLFTIHENLAEVFLFKLSYSPLPSRRSLRLPINKVLYAR